MGAGVDRLPILPSPEFERLAKGAQFRDLIAITVQAPPEAIFAAFDDVSLADMKVAWLLGELRYLPSRLTGHAPAMRPRQPFVANLVEGGTLILHQERPCEIITGSAGQLHRIRDQAPVRFANREAFDAFADANHEKLFMSVRVEPTGRCGEHWLVLEHATHALSPAAERLFARYWRAIKPMGAVVTRELLKAVRRKAEAAGRDIPRAA
jgi:hypothetical protein